MVVWRDVVVIADAVGMNNNEKTTAPKHPSGTNLFFMVFPHFFSLDFVNYVDQ